MKRIYAFLLVLMIALAAGCSSKGREPVEKAVDIGTHHLHALVAGDGLPAVVIDGGVGALSAEYRPLQVRLAARTTVVAYDRAGYGSSEPGPLPRDSGTEAAELRAMLRELGIPAPYVLLGHSLGGLNLEVYAARYPDEVAGLVLLDPPPLGWLLGEDYADLLDMARRMTDEWQETADRSLGSADPDRRKEASFFLMLASEHREMLDRSAHLAAGIEGFGDIPLVVIASGVANSLFGADAAGYQEFWIEQSRALVSKSAQGKLILAKESTHRLHVEAEDLVVESVLSIVAKARTR